MTQSKSRLRRLLIFIVEAVVLIGVLVLIFVKVPALNKMAQRKSESTGAPAGQKSQTSQSGASSQSSGTKPQGSQSGNAQTNSAQQQEGQFDVSVYDVQVDSASGALAVTLQINNPSKVTLQFDPAKQFKLVGQTSKHETSPIKVSGKPTLTAQELKPGQTINGVLYMQKPTNEEYELRFYPNIGDPAYTVVPLIAVPANNQ